MKSNHEKVSTLERKLNIVVSADEVQAAFESAFRAIQQNAAIKGFRKGKVPLATVRKMFKDRVKQDVVQDIVQKNYAAALDEHSLDPIGFPAIEFDQIEESRDFLFSAEFEVRPEVRLAQWERLPVKKERFAPSTDFVENTLEDIRKSRSETVPVFEDRGAQTGDIAVIDFDGLLLTGPLENGSAQDHPLELGTNSFIPGFEEGLMGIKVGETRTLNLAFPEGYQDDLGGKPVTFNVTLKELKKKQLPELNDSFAKDLGGPYQTLDDLKSAIQTDYEKREQRRIDEDLKSRLMKVLVDRNPVEAPKSLMQEQKQALIDDFKNRMSRQGLGEDQFDNYKDKWDADFAQTARFMIQSSFLIDAVAREYNLAATIEDIEAKIAEHAAQTGIDANQVREFYAKDKDRRGRLAYQITEDKVVAFLISKAEVQEVSADELRKTEGPSDPPEISPEL